MSQISREITILIVDDHPVVRQGLKMIIEEEDSFTVCGETGNANEAITLIGKMSPDVVLVDITLQGSATGLDLISSMQERFPSVPALVISMHDESMYAERAIMAGAKGYIMKDEVEDVIVTAIKKVHQGELYLKPDTSLHIVSKMMHQTTSKKENSIDRLTNREFEVFHLMGNGLGTRKIAKKLKISVNTVETHRRHIKSKLNLKDADELVMYAIQWVIESKTG